MMLKDNIPSFVYKMRQMKELLDIEETEMERLEEAFAKLVSEACIDGADDLLFRYEKEYQVHSAPMESATRRRAKILAKKNVRLVADVENMRQTIKELLQAGNVIIQEKSCEIWIYVQTPDLIDHMDIAKDWVHQVRPAHIGYKFINTLERSEMVRVYCGIPTVVRKKKVFEVKI